MVINFSKLKAIKKTCSTPLAACMQIFLMISPPAAPKNASIQLPTADVALSKRRRDIFSIRAYFFKRGAPLLFSPFCKAQQGQTEDRPFAHLIEYGSLKTFCFKESLPDISDIWHLKKINCVNDVFMQVYN